jgi:cytochrome c-type biogenesis protein
MLDITYGGAALAGLLSFLSPCILPMVPFYLSYMAGLSVRELRDGGTIAPGAHRAAGGAGAGLCHWGDDHLRAAGHGGHGAGPGVPAMEGYAVLGRGGVLILFGLHFLGVLRIGLLYREARAEVQTANPPRILGAYVMGLAFGFGWTPCVGPALAAILMVASGMGDLWKGGTLLLVYGLSMTLPFVVAALFAGPFLGWVARHRRR